MSTIKTTNITHGSNSGTANMVLASDGGITFAKTMFASYAILQDQKAANTSGGNSVADSWTTRDLNTEVADPDSITSLSSNKFTLAAGNYLIKWSSTFYKVDVIQTRIYDVTNSATRAVSMGEQLYNQVGSTGNTHGVGRLTPTGSTEYRLEYYATNAQSTTGLGMGNNNGELNVFSNIEIYKEA